MTRDEFNRSMERVLVFYQRPRTPDQVQDFQGYMNVLFDDLRSITGELFEETTKELVRALPRGQKPQPPQFWAIYHKVSEARALAQKQVAPPVDHKAIILADLERIGPEGAKFALEKAEKIGLKLPQWHLDKLIEKTCQLPREDDQQDKTEQTE